MKLRLYHDTREARSMAPATTSMETGTCVDNGAVCLLTNPMILESRPTNPSPVYIIKASPLKCMATQNNPKTARHGIAFTRQLGVFLDSPRRRDILDASPRGCAPETFDAPRKPSQPRMHFQEPWPPHSSIAVTAGTERPSMAHGTNGTWRQPLLRIVRRCREQLSLHRYLRLTVTLMTLRIWP